MLFRSVKGVPDGEQYALVVEMTSKGDLDAFWTAQGDLIDCERPYPATQSPCPAHILAFVHAWLDGNSIIFNDSSSTGNVFDTDFEIVDDSGRALLQECLESARACGWQARVLTTKDAGYINLGW